MVEHTGQFVAYAQGSATDQALAHQLEALRKVNELFQEKTSGFTHHDRTQLMAMKYCRKGDTVRLKSPGRLSHYTADLAYISGYLKNRGVTLELVNNPELNTATRHGELMLKILGAAAKLERANIREQQTEGIAIAKAKGVYQRSPKLKPEQFDEARRLIEQGVPKAKIARDFSSIRQILQEALEELAPMRGKKTRMCSMDSQSLIIRATERREASLGMLNATMQAEKGQFFTPEAVARHMVNLIEAPRNSSIAILDPGAGSGMLTAAAVARIITISPGTKIEVTAIESDPELWAPLKETLIDCEALGASVRLVKEDYIDWALSSDEQFDLVIQNPPYHKIRSKSEQDLTLKANGFVVPNLYAAFMILGASQLKDGGQQISITPRSWMNGTYYSDFRARILSNCAINAIHTFESRSKVFGDMDVLQESIIVSLIRGTLQGDVALYSSRDHTTEVALRTAQADQVVTGDFIYVPATDEDADAVVWMDRASATLEDLGLTVSTGKVVDFRCRKYLSQNGILTSLPMIYPTNIKQHRIEHPSESVKKPQWFDPSVPGAEKLLVPPGTYVLIKRFSAKEERRRIVAAVSNSIVPCAFDNKLNYIHMAGNGIDDKLARGLARWLNCARVDSYFRVFSGHTQVNATDLRRMRFPSREQLLVLADASGSDDEAVERTILDEGDK